MRITNKILASIVTFILSILLIIVGAVLMISIIFFAFGLPLLIIGVLILLISVYGFIHGTLSSFAMLFKRKKQKMPKNDKIIDLKEKDGVFE